ATPEAVRVSSAGGEAPVGDEARTRTEAAVVAREEEGEPRDLLVGAVAPQGDPVLEPRLDEARVARVRVLLDRSHHAVLDRAGVNGVNSDARGGELQGGGLRQPDESVFARHVRAEPPGADE